MQREVSANTESDKFLIDRTLYYKNKSWNIPNAQEAKALNGKQTNRRRQRTQFSVEQLEILESFFVQNHYPDKKLRKRLAKTTQLADERIQVWFQNRRSKYRKKEKGQLFISGLQKDLLNSNAFGSDGNTFQGTNTSNSPDSPNGSDFKITAEATNCFYQQWQLSSRLIGYQVSPIVK